MAKKRIVALITLFSFVLALTACLDDTEVKPPANVKGDSSVISTDVITEGTNTSEDISATDEEITIEEALLYEAEDVKVTVSGYADGFMGPEVKVLVENNSSKNVLVTAESVSINGYMMPYASLYAEVAAGKKANENLYFMTSELEQSGIETVAQMQFYIRISDADTWDELSTSDLITLNTSAVGLEQPVDDSGDILYDSDGIKIVCKGLKQDIVWDGTIVFYMENNSGKPISVYAENVSVNGFMEDAGFWSELRDSTRIVSGMSLLDLSDLELESIDDVKNIEFTLRIINSETWDEIVTTDMITLNFE